MGTHEENRPPQEGEIRRLLEETQHQLEHGKVKKLEKQTKEGLIGQMEEANSYIELVLKEFDNAKVWVEKVLSVEKLNRRKK